MLNTSNGISFDGNEQMSWRSAPADVFESVVRLASRAQMLDAVHAMATHDFRDSLNSMMINIELLSQTFETGAADDKSAALQQRCIQAIRKELRRLANATGNVLGENRADAGEKRRVQLPSVIESIMAMVRGRAMNQHVAVTFTPPDQDIEVVGQPDELRHVIFNIVINALEAMPGGGELKLGLTTDGPMAVITISDTGPGISPDLGSRVWDPLFSTKGQGLGLGLYVARNLAASHGGTLTLEGRQSGVTFTIRLPLEVNAARTDRRRPFGDAGVAR